MFAAIHPGRPEGVVPAMQSPTQAENGIDGSVEEEFDE
jgi:hypothetical protein